MSCLKKPKLRGLLAARTPAKILGALATAVTNALLVKFLYIEPRRRKRAEYYKHFDAEASLKTMSPYLESTGFKQM